MRVTRRYNQYRRDLTIDMECENCGATDTYGGAYDDRNFWDNVVPAFKCSKCGKSTKDLGPEPEVVPTKYPEGRQL